MLPAAAPLVRGAEVARRPGLGPPGTFGDAANVSPRHLCHWFMPSPQNACGAVGSALLRWSCHASWGVFLWPMVVDPLTTVGAGRHPLPVTGDRGCRHPDCGYTCSWEEC